MTLLLALTLSCAWVATGCSGGGSSGSTHVSSASSTDVAHGTTAPTGSTSTEHVEPTTTTVPFASTTTAPPQPSTTLPPRPAVHIPEGGLEYTRLPGDERVVALTFDAAYDPAPLADILAVLHDREAAATFFLTGEFVKDHLEDVQAIIASGHPIGSHSYSHPDFTTLTATDIDTQLDRTAKLLEQAGARDPRPLFRFPYGARDERTLREVGSWGYVSVYWTVDALDWKAGRTSEAIRSDVLDKVRPGAIVLMHVGSAQTAAILPRLIDDLRADGYDLVDLRSALPAVDG